MARHVYGVNLRWETNEQLKSLWYMAPPSTTVGRSKGWDGAILMVGSQCPRPHSSKTAFCDVRGHLAGLTGRAHERKEAEEIELPGKVPSTNSHLMATQTFRVRDDYEQPVKIEMIVRP